MKTYTLRGNLTLQNLFISLIAVFFSAYVFAQPFEFTRHIIDSDSGWIYGMHAADLDQDGDVDAFAANWVGNNFRWYENNGTGAFTIHSIDNAASGASFITTADIDSDGDLDVLGVKWGSNTMDWYENDGNENFTKHQIATNLNAPQSAAIVDIEGDGDQDLLLAVSGGVTLYTNDGNESFTTSLLSTESNSVYVSTSDIDQDGDYDVILSALSGIYWYENDGSGNFASHTLNTSISGAYAVIAADLDGDNDVDIVSTSNSDNSILWYENDGNESFTIHTVASQNKARGLAVADLDKDGNMDVLVASQNSSGDVNWYKNDGNQSFTVQSISSTGSEGGNNNFVYTEDFDGDGIDLDILVMGSNGNHLSWYESADIAAPTISSSATAAIDENSGAGQLVYTITADDNVGVTSYAIGGTDASAFSVNATTGAVTLTANPDYETKSSYSFTVTASDAAGNTSAAQTVTLAINDLSEIIPAYLIDHRGIPLFDENDVMQSASYSDLQAAGLSADHLQTHPDGDTFYWEIPSTDIPAEDFESSGVRDFGYVWFAGDVYAFENQYYFVPKDEPSGFPADAYNATTGDFHFLPSAQAVANTINENGEARIGDAFWEEASEGLTLLYTLADLSIILPILDYGDTHTLDNDFEGVITLQLTDGNTGDISFSGNGNLSSVLDLGSVITSHTQITIDDAATGAASITLPDTNASTFSFSNQRWLSYTTSDSEGNPWQVGVYIGSGADESVTTAIFISAGASTALADIHEIVVYGLDGHDDVFFSPAYIPSMVVSGEFYGGLGDDEMTGISDDGSTRLYGGDGNDKLQGHSHDIAFGGSGEDDIRIHTDGVTNNLTIFGGDDNDKIIGGSGDERLYGGSGRDIIHSNDGHDVIFGGDGNDQLHAGDGVDIFVFDGNGDGSDEVGTTTTPPGNDIFQNEDKLYFINTTMTSRDDLSISATVINANEVVSIAYTDAPSVDNINFYHVDIEDAHLQRRSNIIFEDSNGNVTVNVDEGATGAVYWPVITDESFDYAAISHSISGSGADNGLFSIDATTGGLSFNTAPNAGTPHDTNADGIYEVSLMTTDGTNNFSKSLTIYINETQPPTFDSSATATAIDENSGENQAVYTIEASDNVGVVRYGIGADDAATFDVDPDSGVVTLLENPDYEKTPSYSFEVRAFDAQENVASMIVTLAINDLDDEAPTISSSATAAIDENSGAGQQVYMITADDNVGATSFAIGGTDASHFTVNATTGKVTLTADPDYETKASYSFTVTASDAAGNTSAAQTVSLTINDLNDNAPVFSSGSTVSVAEGQTATGYTASATDADAGSTISYSITGGADHTLFTLTGGVLSFSAAPDYETPGDDDGNNDYEVVVTATDGTHGTPQTVTVTVTDVDETAPALTETPRGEHDENGVATIDLSLSEEVSLDGDSIAEDFTIAGAASNPVVTNIYVSGSDVTLTLSGVVVQGETVELSYTKSENAGSIVDGSGNRLGDFSNVTVNFVTFDLNEPKGTEIFFTNPVSDRLEIHSGSVVKRVALYSLTGRKVLDQRPYRKAPSIDISSLAQAIYLMKVETETNQITMKLVKL